MLIGELADAAGVGVETIRFYEREGLLPEPPRSEAGYRLYEPEAVRRVHFIRRAKDLGFTLRECAELLALRVDDASKCADVEARARRKVDQIDAKMNELSAMRRALQTLIRACVASEKTGECPILDSLEEKAAVTP